MSENPSRENVKIRVETTGLSSAQQPQCTSEAVTIRHLRGATEYRGRRDALLASGAIRGEWLPPERIPGQRMRATLHARDGGRDVFVRRLDDGRHCVLVIHTPSEREQQERAAFGRFMGKLLDPPA